MQKYFWGGLKLKDLLDLSNGKIVSTLLASPDEFLFIREVPGYGRALIAAMDSLLKQKVMRLFVVLPQDFDSYLALSLKTDFRSSYAMRGTIFQLIC